MTHVTQGSQAAAWELVETYGEHVERVVRRSLSRALRSKFNSSDFVQAVWASFFKQRERFDNLEDANALIGFLIGIARNKMLEENRRRFQTQKTDVRRETSLVAADGSCESLADREPSPSQWAIARERWQNLVRHQTPAQQRIVELRVSGATFEEIGETLGISERTARRVIDGLLAGFAG